MLHLLTNCLGWKTCNLENYQQAWQQFGGSVLTNPQILQFLNERFKPDVSFWHCHDRQGKLTGAICIWDKKIIAGDKRYLSQLPGRHYPLNADEIALPLAPDWRGILPWQTRFLSSLNQPNVRNTSYRFNARREICIAHKLKRKTRLSRQNELKRFIQAGGSIHPISELSHKEIIHIFTRLMYLRRNIQLDPQPLQDLLTSVPDLLFGHMLAFNGEPCAMQWIVKSEDPHHIWLDFVNNAMSLAHPELYIGSVLTWINTSSAFDYAQQHGKILRYSFGQPTAKYKDLWCDRLPLYRVIA